jgi:hypothetical protein
VDVNVWIWANYYYYYYSPAGGVPSAVGESTVGESADEAGDVKGLRAALVVPLVEPLVVPLAGLGEAGCGASNGLLITTMSSSSSCTATQMRIMRGCV